MDFVKQLLNGDFGSLAQFGAYFLAVNLFLSGTGAALDSIKDKTATNVDNVAAKWINSIAGWAKKIVDLSSANRPH